MKQLSPASVFPINSATRIIDGDQAFQLQQESSSQLHPNQVMQQQQQLENSGTTPVFNFNNIDESMREVHEKESTRQITISPPAPTPSHAPTPVPQLASIIKKLGTNQQTSFMDKKQRTFLISSIQPSIHARDMFKRVLKKRQDHQNFAALKPKNYIKMSLVYIEKFIRLMKQQSSAHRFRACGKKHLNIINDKSSDFEYYLVNRFFSNETPSFFKLLAIQISRIKFISWFKSRVITNLNLDQVEFLILPNSIFYMMWSLFLLIVLTLNVLYVPVQMAFYDVELSPFVEVCLDTIPNFCFILEILVKFNTAIYKKGLIIKSRRKIVGCYLQKRFWYDLLIVFCFLGGSFSQQEYLQTILLIRFFDIIRLMSILEDRYNLRERLYGVIDLAKLILFILFIAHLCGCIFHYIAYLEYSAGSARTWLGHSEDLPFNEAWEVRYLNSLYWSVVTMCTLGYGDIIPVTMSNQPTNHPSTEFPFSFRYFTHPKKEEKAFTICVTLISCFVFGYSVNSIGDILKEFLRIEEEFKVKMAKLNVYMKKRELDHDVSVKVRKYFEYLHKEEELQSNEEGASLIDSLEHDLKSEVLKDIYGKLLRTKKLFHLNFSIDALAVKIKEKTVGLNEFVYKENDVADNIYFLLRGKIDVIKTSTSTEFFQIQKGMMFGEIEFFTGELRQFSMRARSVAQLAYLPKSDFIEAIQNQKEEYEKFRRLSDSIVIYSDMTGMDHVCGSCGKYTHLLVNCPQINFVINKQKTLSSQNLSKAQERNPGILRLRCRSINSLNKTKLNQQLAMAFQNSDKFQQYSDLEHSNVEDEPVGNQNGTNGSLNSGQYIFLNQDKKISERQASPLAPAAVAPQLKAGGSSGQKKQNNSTNNISTSNNQFGIGKSESEMEKSESIGLPKSISKSVSTIQRKSIKRMTRQQQLLVAKQQNEASQYNIKITENEATQHYAPSAPKGFLEEADEDSESISFSQSPSHFHIKQLLTETKQRHIMQSYFNEKSIAKLLSQKRQQIEIKGQQQKESPQQLTEERIDSNNLNRINSQPSSLTSDQSSNRNSSAHESDDNQTEEIKHEKTNKSTTILQLESNALMNNPKRIQEDASSQPQMQGSNNKNHSHTHLSQEKKQSESQTGLYHLPAPPLLEVNRQNNMLNALEKYPSSEINKRVSILVKNPNKFQKQLNLRLTVNEKETEQLLEVLELEQGIDRRNLLKKTAPFKARQAAGKMTMLNPNTIGGRLYEEDSAGAAAPGYAYYAGQQPNRNLIHQRRRSQMKSQINVTTLAHIDHLNQDVMQMNRSQVSQISQQMDDSNLPDGEYEGGAAFQIDELEIRKFQQIYLKNYDEEFIANFEVAKEYKEYFPKNNIGFVLEFLNIRRKLNPFYRELLIRKKIKNKGLPMNRLNYQKAIKKTQNLRAQFNSTFMNSQISSLLLKDSTIHSKTGSSFHQTISNINLGNSNLKNN